MAQGPAKSDGIKSTDASSVDIERGQLQTEDKVVLDVLYEILSELKELKELIMDIVQ